MSAIASIAIQDGKATPATHTFNGVKSGPQSLWRTADAALPLIGQESITANLRRTKSGVNIVQVVMELPALETITAQNAAGYTAAPKVGYRNRVVAEFFLPDRGTSAQRTDLRTLLKNLLSNAQIVDLVDNLTPAN